MYGNQNLDPVHRFFLPISNILAAQLFVVILVGSIILIFTKNLVTGGAHLVANFIASEVIGFIMTLPRVGFKMWIAKQSLELEEKILFLEYHVTPEIGLKVC